MVRAVALDRYSKAPKGLPGSSRHLLLVSKRCCKIRDEYGSVYVCVRARFVYMYLVCFCACSCKRVCIA